MTADYTQMVEGCKRRDRKAERALYEAMAPMAMGICLRYVRDREEAQDLMQDGFVRVFENIGRLREPLQVRTWVYRVMLNVCFKHYHRQEGKVPTMLADVEQVTLPLDPFSAEEIVAAVQQLSPAQRMAFNLLAVEEYSYAEAAKELHCSEVNVRALYSRAKKELRNILNKR